MKTDLISMGIATDAMMNLIQQFNDAEFDKVAKEYVLKNLIPVYEKMKKEVEKEREKEWKRFLKSINEVAHHDD